MTEDMMEIRCCCDASKVLGWLPAPCHGRSAAVFALRIKEGYSRPGTSRVETLTLEVAKLYSSNGNASTGIAYKNPDLSIETLRRIPSFVEAR